MANVLYRLKRAVRELLSMPQWPKDYRIELGRFQARCLEEQIYKAIICEGDICYDIGANIGEISLLFSMLTGPKGKVVSFEPVWPTYQKLCSNIQKADCHGATIITIPSGLAESEKTALIQVPSGDFGMASLAESSRWSDVNPGTGMQSYECRFTTLDGLLKQTCLPSPDFVKVDVEGAELFVLRGAQGFFDAGHRPLMLIEIFAPWEYAFGYQPWDVLSLLTGLGYAFLFVCPEGLVQHEPSEQTPFPEQYAQGYNILAFQPEAHAGRIDRLSTLRQGSGGLILAMDPPPMPNVIRLN